MRRVVSFAIKVIDRLTRNILDNNQLVFQINGNNVKPIYKNDGYFVFTDLPNGNYFVKVTGHEFQQEILEIKCNKDNPPKVIVLPLNPSEYYINKEGKTSVKGNLLDKKRNPLQNIDYYVIPDEDTAILKLIDTEVKEGSEKLKIYCPLPKNKTPVPGKFIIRDVENDSYEVISILRVENDNFFLEKPLEKGYGRKSTIVEIINGKTDSDGFFYILLDNDKLGDKCNLEINFNYNDSLKKQLNIKQGDLIDIGQIIY